MVALYTVMQLRPDKGQRSQVLPCTVFCLREHSGDATSASVNLGSASCWAAGFS